MRLLTLLLFAPASAFALSLTLQSSSTPHPGVTLYDYRSSSPAADVWVAEVDLCADGVSIEASKASSSLSTTGSWASGRGLQLGVNGDFYRTGPVRVYGDAIGEGIPWPLDQTGLDPDYSSDWNYKDYGWLAFGHDRVRFTHTKWTKQNASPSTGWRSGTIAPEAAPGTLALVSGFPQLVTDGAVHTCSDPADGCFPDRSDMDVRHPRTAMGISQDKQTLWLVVVDGRSTSSAGMRGAELAAVMGELGAWQAFNLDGGGSSQLWVQGQGTVNNPSDGSPRSVANHWGVRASGSGRPAHCPVEPACGTIPAAGGTIDEEGACFQHFGPSQYWREESDGQGGHLYWTNAWNTDQASNWAWWRFELEQAGRYELEFYADPDFAVFPRTNTLVVADGTEHWLTVDHGAASGWTSLGAFDFAAGGDQFLAVYDDGSNVGSNQHIVADAVRLVRVDEYCGNGVCGGNEDCASCPGDCPIEDEILGNGADEDCDGEVDESPPMDTDELGRDTAAGDTGDTGWSDSAGGDVQGDTGQGDSAAADTDVGSSPRVVDGQGCGCRSTSLPGAALFLGLPLLLRRRST